MAEAEDAYEQVDMAVQSESYYTQNKTILNGNMAEAGDAYEQLDMAVQSESYYTQNKTILNGNMAEAGDAYEQVGMDVQSESYYTPPLPSCVNPPLPSHGTDQDTERIGNHSRSESSSRGIPQGRANRLLVVLLVIVVIVSIGLVAWNVYITLVDKTGSSDDQVLNQPNGKDITTMSSSTAIHIHDCLDVKNAGLTETGVYTIRMKRTNETVDVLCDMDSQGGGWTVFQHRFNGSIEFNRTFDEYSDGFGSPYSEHWLGLRYIYELTQDPSTLNIELEAADGSRAYQIWQSFAISADPDYELDISGGSGTAGDLPLGIQYNNGHKFSAIGRDVSAINCVEERYGGWWYNYCAYANLNGYYAEPGTTLGYNGRQEAAMTYWSFKGVEALKASSMMLRRNTI